MVAKASQYTDFTAEEIAAIDSPELTDEELAVLRPAVKALSPKLYAALTARKPGQRGPQKTPTKEMITLRLDRDVLAAYRATGPGWQTRMNDALKAATRPKATKRTEAKAAASQPVRRVRKQATP